MLWSELVDDMLERTVIRCSDVSWVGAENRSSTALWLVRTGMLENLANIYRERSRQSKRTHPWLVFSRQRGISGGWSWRRSSVITDYSCCDASSRLWRQGPSNNNQCFVLQAWGEVRSCSYYGPTAPEYQFNPFIRVQVHQHKPTS